MHIAFLMMFLMEKKIERRTKVSFLSSLISSLVQEGKTTTHGLNLIYLSQKNDTRYFLFVFQQKSIVTNKLEELLGEKITLLF